VANKPKRLLAKRLEQEIPGYHAVMRLATMANCNCEGAGGVWHEPIVTPGCENPRKLTPELLAKLNESVASYTEPKLKAIDHSGTATVIVQMDSDAKALT